MQEIYDKLSPVRRRQKLARSVRLTGIGLVAGSLVAVILAVASSLSAIAVLQLLGWIALVCGPIVGLAMAQIAPTNWLSAAQAVDGHFPLDSRVQSAVTFLEQGKLTGLYALQIADTVTILADLDTAAAVPSRLPKPLMIGSGWAAVAVALLLFLPLQTNTDGSVHPEVTEQPGRTESDSTDDTKPLPASATFEPAINRQVEIAAESKSLLAPPATTGESSNTSKLLDLRIDAAYRLESGP